ncbi:MAG: VWA domain-containing protein [Rhodocyclaceae bacterium]|nr:VWA domain-containing protein [Rhodocyclaceae bacterium]MBX3668268.1 VWA domain-containing protein [Rhodocyclaceae bacterium]
MKLSALFSVLLLLLAACGDKQAPTLPPPAVTEAADFVVLATSDLRDLQPLQDMALKATGVKLSFRFGTTLESTQAVLTGQAQAHAAWFANAKYLLASQEGLMRVKLQEKIMLSPIAIGVSERDARQYGWDNPALKLTWKDVGNAARDGKLRYAMSNPATSNQGFMALMGVVAAASGKTEALNAADVDRSAIRDFLKGYAIVGSNSTELSEKFIQQQGVRANAFINYESWLLSLNASGKLREKLLLIYPYEGVSTADYPFMLLDDARRDDYIKLVAWLKTDATQLWLARHTLRRPIQPEVAAKVADLLPKPGLQIELPFSPSKALAEGLISAYQNEFRKPIASVWVLDTSGSMASHGRREQLLEAIAFIAGADSSLTGRIANLNHREKFWLQPFSDTPYGRAAFEVPAIGGQGKDVEEQADSEAKRKVLAQVRQMAGNLKMKGHTALYDAVYKSLRLMLAERERNPNYQYSVAVFTDGENNRGRSIAQFKHDYSALPKDVKDIPVFWVFFGDANEAALKDLAQFTGGQVFDGRKDRLNTVFARIRENQ